MLKTIWNVYLHVDEKQLENHVATLEDVGERNKHKESLWLINSIDSLKATKRGIIQGSSLEERLE